ncbi:pre-rRNA-processing protein esf1, partial [Ascosphaera atra]
MRKGGKGKKERESKKEKKGKKGKKEESESESESASESSESSDDDESGEEDTVVRRELDKADKRTTADPSYDAARGGGFSESSSSESSSDEESEEEQDDVEELEYQQRTGIPLGEVTSRIAVVNLDWDNIRAEDLLVVFSSFCPDQSGVDKVSVYPSEFGKERMEREAIEGPPREVFADGAGKQDSEIDSDESDLEDDERIKRQILQQDEGKEFDDTRLRKYQLERLRYYYAVLTCRSPEVAKHIYDSVDGTEYEATANFFDLRFVPDDVSFDDDTPRDECTRLPEGYRPNEFVTDALQHSKVKLTWDADDKQRKDAQARAFRAGREELNENDLKAYLGSDSSSEDEEDNEAVEVVDATTDGEKKKLSKKEEARRKMRALLGLPEEPLKEEPAEKKPVGSLEVTFSAGLSANPQRGTVFINDEPEKEETTMEKYIRKERERKARRKAKLKAMKRGEKLPDGDGSGSGSSDSEGDKGDAPQGEAEEPAEDLGFDDPFFTEPEYDAAAAAAKRKEDKRKKREEREADERAEAARRAELELLMMDDKAATGSNGAGADGAAGIRHFDMKEVEKAEKQAAKRGKKKSKYGKTKEADRNLVPEDFEINTKDPR